VFILLVFAYKLYIAHSSIGIKPLMDVIFETYYFIDPITSINWHANSVCNALTCRCQGRAWCCPIWAKW